MNRILPIDIVKSYAAQWRSLAAWRSTLETTVEVIEMPDHIRRRLGTAKVGEHRAIVYVTGNLACDLSTVLHELAHLAAPRCARHEQPWREIYIAATVEAIGGDVEMFEPDVAINMLDAQVEAAIETWLNSTGQLAVFRAVGVVS